MKKKVWGWSVLICLAVIGRSWGEVSPKSSLPEGAEKMWGVEYSCSITEAGSPSFKAATRLEKSAVADWVDILPWIKPYHLAQGFIDILLSVNMHEVEGAERPTWYMVGDTDDVGKNDIRAYGDGAFYDLIDRDFKAERAEDIFEDRGEHGDCVVLRFGLPKKVVNYYKIFIGKESVKLTIKSEVYGEIYDKYTDLCKVEFYLAPPPSNVYACCDLLNIPITYYDETGEPIEAIRRVPLNTPIMFDASGSLDLTGETITKYTFDFDNNIDPGADISGPEPVVTHTYTTLGRKKVIVVVKNEEGETSITNGDVRASKSSAPLPLWVEVVEPPEKEKEEEVAKLYQCAPHPFVSSQSPGTRIKYTIYSPCEVTIKIYSFSGDLVRTLMDGKEKQVGEWVREWDGTNDAGAKVGSGVYFCQMEAGELRTMKRIVVIK